MDRIHHFSRQFVVAVPVDSIVAIVAAMVEFA
jgi:hypothetical protein